MTITYDSEGKCTRCGSTGYYLSSYTSDSSFEDTRMCIKPCPCHGWRPIETAPYGRDHFVLLCDGSSVEVGSWDSERYAKRPCPHWHIAWMGKVRSREFSARVTHWQPLPEPPEQEGA